VGHGHVLSSCYDQHGARPLTWMSDEMISVVVCQHTAAVLLVAFSGDRPGSCMGIEEVGASELDLDV